MLHFLSRRWFLLLLLVGLSSAVLRPAWVAFLVEPVPPRFVVAAALFLMAWSLESSRLWQGLRRPAPTLWALTIGYTILPLLAWSLGWLLPDPQLRIGLLISACVPCTLASCVIWTRLAGGNEATALVTVVLSNTSSWLITPFLLTLTTSTHGAQVDYLELMQNLLFVLLVPVLLGQLSRRIPGVADTVRQYKTLNSVLARLLIFAIILKAAVRLVEHLSDITLMFVVASVAVCVVVHLAAFVFGFWTSQQLWPREDAIAIGFAGSQKTLPVGLYLYQNYFQAVFPLAVVPMVLYHVLQLVVDTFLADRLRPDESLPETLSGKG